jgi:hypothetical protein
MRRFRVSASTWLAAAALAGCASGEATYGGGEVKVSSPELVAIQPGVEVVADADEPLFYTDGYYWLYRDGAWLRSDSYRDGFAHIDVTLVPDSLRQLPSPRSYAHFRHTDRGRALARGSQLPQRGHMPVPQPPQPAHPAQPNPMPEQERRQRQERPDLPNPTGAETGTPPPTTPPATTGQPNDEEHPRKLHDGEVRR